MFESGSIPGPPQPGEAYRPPVHLAPEPRPPRCRNRLARLAKVEPFYRALLGGTLGLLAAAVVLRAYGVSGWWPALAAAFAAPAAGWVIAERGGNRRGQAEAAVLAGLAGGWVSFVAAAGWDPHYHGVPFAPFVPAGGLGIGVAAVGCLAEHRAANRDRAIKAARAAGMSGGSATVPPPAESAPASPAPAKPARPARPGPDEGVVQEIAAVAGVQFDEVRVLWAHVTEHGGITARAAGDLLGMSKSSGQRRLARIENAGYLRKTGPDGNERFVPVRAGLLHRVK